ncbi:diadenylate cyclase CdaA [Helicovermis profundi]|uniref:Diadenylate cyclase n=1 Tax=Helicovermis profundi TaxID=3065157 RepID=A0AAU9E9D1_9FIRM|nr:diadenylate cyclase CdaA [Clostridia bacterium S502]
MESIINVFMNIRIQDIIDILIVAYVFNKLLFLIKETRAEQLIKGLIILLIIQKLSEWAQLYVVQFILKNTMTLGLVALLIVFQPELRRALEYIGRSKLFEQSLADVFEEERKRTFKEITKSVASLSRDRTGALIVMEKQTGLNEIISTGIKIDSLVSSELLLNIFIPNTPLHDGALVVRKNKIMAAGCILPLTENQKISKELGTRHRAALGVAEISDAVVIIVSEETGAISVAMDGKLNRFLDTNTLENILVEAFRPSNNQVLIKRRWRFNNEHKNKII